MTQDFMSPEIHLLAAESSLVHLHLECVLSLGHRCMMNPQTLRNRGIVKTHQWDSCVHYVYNMCIICVYVYIYIYTHMHDMFMYI